jgi:hypothetical protein
MKVCTHAHTCPNMHVYTQMRKCVCPHAHAHTPTDTSTRTHASAHTDSHAITRTHTNAPTHICAHTCTHKHTHGPALLHTHTCAVLMPFFASTPKAGCRLGVPQFLAIDISRNVESGHTRLLQDLITTGIVMVDMVAIALRTCNSRLHFACVTSSPRTTLYDHCLFSHH